MKLDSDDFELFGVHRQFEQDAATLDARWRTLLAESHPDRFVSEGAQAQRLAMQWSVRINEAHRRLKDPLARAAYLCELSGVPVRAEDNTAMPGSFLMQQMAWRESLDDAATLAEVEALASEVATHRQQALGELRRLLDEQHDPAAAAQQVRALMFVERFASDVDRRLEALEQ
jgi:molecular chaperone HscB